MFYEIDISNVSTVLSTPVYRTSNALNSDISDLKMKLYIGGDSLGSKLVIDDSTGEIVDEIYEGDRIYRKKSLDAFIEWIGFSGNKPFCKLNIEEYNLWTNDLNKDETYFLGKVFSIIGYGDNCLIQKNNKSHNFDTLRAYVGMGKSQFSLVISSLKNKGLIYVGKSSKYSQYFLNPWIICRGTRLNSMLKRMFENYYIRSKGVKWRDLKNE